MSGFDRPAHHNAAAELSDRLRSLAADLRGVVPSRRIRYRPPATRLGHRRSPEGVALDAHHDRLQLLLPDGRLWEYCRRLHSHPDGRFYDAGVDYVSFVHSRLGVDGIEFAYLGATIGKYSFGVVEHSLPRRAPRSGALCALSQGGASWLVEPDVAFTDIANGLTGAARPGPASRRVAQSR